MKAAVFRLLCLLLVFFSIESILAGERVPNEFLVRYREEPSRLFASGLVGSPRDVHVISDHRPGRWLQIWIESREQVDVLQSLREHPEVVSVTPNFWIDLDGAEPVDRLLPTMQQWSLDQIHLRDAWARAGNRGSRKIVVALIDAGVDASHPDLAGRLLPGYNFVDNNRDTSDVTGHGTHCAGIIGAHGNVEGASPEVSILPVRFVNEAGRGDTAAAIKGIDYAVQHHVDVISASWGAKMSEEDAGPMVESIARARNAGIAFVAAAGNQGNDNDQFASFPANANLSNVISVTSTGEHDERSDFANFGSHSVHIGAPGQSIVSTLPGGRYGEKSGTSMATPLVAGLVAFLKAQDPTLTAEQVGALLQLTGEKANATDACHCRVDARGAVNAFFAKSLFIYPASARLKEGARRRFGARFGHPPYRFQVSNSQVAEISRDGILHARHAGTTTVSVVDRDGHQSTSFEIQVK